MIVRNSQRVPPCSAREPRSDAISVASDRGKLNLRARHDRLIAPEAQNHGLDNLSDQSGTAVLIGIARHGLGTIVRPFCTSTFHDPLISEGKQHDHS